MKGDRERCLAAGMDAYVSKPIKSEELFQTIESLLPVPTAQEARIGRVGEGAKKDHSITCRIW